MNSRFDIVTGGCGFIGSHFVDALLAKGREVSVIDNLAVGRRANLFHHEKNSRLRIIEADISMIQRDLKWKPKVSIGNGVTMLLDQLSDWQDAPLWNETDISAATADWFKYLGSNSMEEIR